MLVPKRDRELDSAKTRAHRGPDPPATAQPACHRASFQVAGDSKDYREERMKTAGTGTWGSRPGSTGARERGAISRPEPAGSHGR